MLKKKLPRYIIEKEEEKKKRRMKEKWFARFKEERSLKGIFGKTNSLALEKVALVGGTRDRNESTTVTGTLFFRLTRETKV